MGKDVVLVTSGAISCGKKALGLKEESDSIAFKQACAAIGQAKLIMTYEKLFSEYNHISAQILMNRDTVCNNLNRYEN